MKTVEIHIFLSQYLKLTLQAPTPLNCQTHSINSSVTTDKLSECVWAFVRLALKGLMFHFSSNLKNHYVDTYINLCSTAGVVKKYLKYCTLKWKFHFFFFFFFFCRSIPFRFNISYLVSKKFVTFTRTSKVQRISTLNCMTSKKLTSRADNY